MTSTPKAGAIYALAVFSVGFVLGAIRTLLVAPRLGETAAVSLEVPIMLAASWYISRPVSAGIPARFIPRLAMGLVAFAILMSLEFALALAFGRSAAEYIAAYASTPGAIGLAAQIAFAFIPLLQAKLLRPS